MQPGTAFYVSAVSFSPYRSFRLHALLQKKQKKKHTSVSDVARFVRKSPRCYVCSTAFSTRPKLLAHLSESRSKGQRKSKCDGVVRSGLVAPVPDAEFREAHEADRKARGLVRKRGHTQPLCTVPAKRNGCESGVRSQQLRSMLRARPTSPLFPRTSLSGVVCPRQSDCGARLLSMRLS